MDQGKKDASLNQDGNGKEQTDARESQKEKQMGLSEEFNMNQKDRETKNGPYDYQGFLLGLVDE